MLAREKSDYNDIYLIQNGADREMRFRKKNDFFLQSRLNIDEPDALVLVYSKRIFSSEEYFLRVLRRIFLTTDSLDTFLPITTSHWESLRESIS